MPTRKTAPDELVTWFFNSLEFGHLDSSGFGVKKAASLLVKRKSETLDISVSISSPNIAAQLEVQQSISFVPSKSEDI